MNNINQTLLAVDPAIAAIIDSEYARQRDCIELIASENFASAAVRAAQGSILTNKYAEGYPGKRYYCGCQEVDKIERLAIERAKKLFGCEYANVQPHSGSQANQAVFLALLQPGDTILSMSMDSGGHLTHGALPNMSGKWFKAVHYGVDPESELIDYDQVEILAKLHRPKLIIAGYSAYTRKLDFAKFRAIADLVGAYFMADIAHIAGLVAAGFHQSPLTYADVVTSTTHKTLRGPRGGIILSNDQEIAKKIDSALFPGLQGGPLIHVIAAKAVAFVEALHDDYRQYIQQVLLNARILGETLQKNGYKILTGGTDNHMVIVDLRKQNITGKIAAESLDRAGIACNKNNIPFDTTSPFVTSGIRLGSPACTTRGFKEQEFIQVGELISNILHGITNNTQDNSAIERQVLEKVLTLTKQFQL
ncbi:Serine hydroxymethyltransferase [Candidatus Trichorickettsia mobilis]|uniref:Serine hydroxymethyltransferase n=1 Tax=Candidatus Trichorickettsia mobilis TaxID=1346319 RepID=A0ABZ0USW6_9RICK|nr:serine hydroxymethyltransferase [Candidatus Trichorickettsia mobilis]WPY01125.1 Serine hydroxymethyltransferase [Candidatus Trichorickettsia mobilis]